MLLYAVTMSRRVRGSACRRIFHTSRASDAVTYEPGQIVEFHRMAKGVVRRGVQEKRFKSGEQWVMASFTTAASVLYSAPTFS